MLSVLLFNCFSVYHIVHVCLSREPIKVIAVVILGITSRIQPAAKLIIPCPCDMLFSSCHLLSGGIVLCRVLKGVSGNIFPGAAAGEQFSFVVSCLSLSLCISSKECDSIKPNLDSRTVKANLSTRTASRLTFAIRIQRRPYLRNV
jgi:hypothetical protein